MVRACLSNEYGQDAFFELAREIREAKFHRQVASRLEGEGSFEHPTEA